MIPPAADFYRDLAFSPDGNYIYFRKAANLQGTQFDVYRAPILGGTPRAIARDVDSDLAFSPEGRRIAYVRANDPEPGKYRLLSANATAAMKPFCASPTPRVVPIPLTSLGLRMASRFSIRSFPPAMHSLT